MASTPLARAEALALSVEGAEHPVAVEQAIFEELGGQSASAGSRMRVRIDDERVEVRFERPGHDALTRAIERPAREEELLAAVAWLAGNLARDQTTALLDGFARPPSESAAAAHATSLGNSPAGSELPSAEGLPPGLHHFWAIAGLPAAPLRPTLVSEPDAGAAEPSRLRWSAVGYASSARLINLGVELGWGMLAARVSGSLHPLDQGWAGVRVAAGPQLVWDGPYLQLFASYGYRHALEVRVENVFGFPITDATDRHTLGMGLVGGWQLNDWLSPFVGLGVDVDVADVPVRSSRWTPDLALGARFF
jgi:hypothetical protein